MLRTMNKVQKDQSKWQQQPLPDSPSDSCFFPSNGVKQKARNPSLFTVPGLFVGFSTKGLSDSDAVRSPTSPLDFKSFSNLSSSFLGSPRSGSAGHDGRPRYWDCSRVGLGLVDTLSDETRPCGKPLGLSGSRNILFGPQMSINISSLMDDDSFAAAPKSLPKDYAMSSRIQNGASKPLPCCSRMSLQSKGAESERRAFGLQRSCSAEISRSSSPLTESMYQNSESDFEVFPSNPKRGMRDSSSSSSQFVEGSADFDKFSGSLPISVDGSFSGVVTSLSASEIEQSEDYTCIISHGPNPKTTHLFGDCVLESHSFPSKDSKNKHNKDQEWSSWLLKPSQVALPCSSIDDFLSFCFFCKKKLEEGRDIYMYRGEKAFCSFDCRDQEILIEEEMEENPGIESSGSPASPFHDEMFLDGVRRSPC